MTYIYETSREAPNLYKMLENFSENNHIFECKKSIGTKSYFTTYKIKMLSNNKYNWTMNIAKQKDSNSYLEFPVGFYNPYNTKIHFGVVIDEQFAGHYSLEPNEIKSLFKDEIYPFIPYSSSVKGNDANINILLENSNEPLIVYCKLHWTEIENIFFIKEL
jgi:hypothetical protein